MSSTLPHNSSARELIDILTVDMHVLLAKTVWVGTQLPFHAESGTLVRIPKKLAKHSGEQGPLSSELADFRPRRNQTNSQILQLAPR